MNSDFRVLERDVTGVFISHDCQFVNEGYFRTVNSLRTVRNFHPVEGTPAAAKTEEIYKSRLKESREKVFVLKAYTINDLWSSVSLNVPGTIYFEGNRVPEQICQDLPRIQYLVLDGFNIYSNQPPIQNPCVQILGHLKPITKNYAELFRLATLLTQSSLDNIFLNINDYFTQEELGYNVTHHTFSTIYIQTNPLLIRTCRLFKIISIKDGEALGYVKGERVFHLDREDLIFGVASLSKVRDCISPFFNSLNEATAFSWINNSSICLVS